MWIFYHNRIITETANQPEILSNVIASAVVFTAVALIPIIICHMFRVDRNKEQV